MIGRGGGGERRRVDATDVHQQVAVLEVWPSPLKNEDASLAVQERETGGKGRGA